MTVLQMGDGLGSRPDSAGEESEVHQRSEVAIAFGKPWARRGVLDDSDFETLLDEFAHVAFDAQVGGHSRQDDLVHAALAQLEHEVV